MVGKVVSLKLLMCSLLVSGSSFAVDNPDAFDFTQHYKTQVNERENQINQSGAAGVNVLEQYSDYMSFLDSELNKAYGLARSKISFEEFEKLKASQRQWIKYRDAEFGFIDANWTRENFGSSSTVSRLQYKASLLKSRTIQIYDYVKNY